jgi:hypothetical protein
LDINDFISKDEIQKELDKKPGGGEMADNRFWRIPDGKSKVRLLPRLEARVPWKTVYSHRYNQSGEKLFSTCMLTFGKKGCPICKKSWSMWESEDKNVKDLGYQVRKTPRYFFNGYIVEDNDKPENVGTIKIISVGKKLFDLILESYNSDDLGKSIFDAINGFDFEINRKKSGDNPNFPDYSSSRFVFKKGPVVKSWDAIKDKLINIDELVKEETPDELMAKWKFLGFDVTEAPKVNKERKPAAKKEVEEDVTLDELVADTSTGEEVLTDEIALDDDIEDELSKL